MPIAPLRFSLPRLRGRGVTRSQRGSLLLPHPPISSTMQTPFLLFTLLLALLTFANPTPAVAAASHTVATTAPAPHLDSPKGKTSYRSLRQRWRSFRKQARQQLRQWRQQVADPGVMVLAVLGIAAAVVLVVFLTRMSFVLGMLGLLLAIALLYYVFGVVG